MYASGEGTRTTIHNIDLKWNELAMKLMSGTWLSRRVRAGKPREIDTLATMTTVGAQSTSHFLVGKSTFLDFYIENNPLTLNYYKKSLILKL